MNTREIKRIIRLKYAWPGGYELFLITSDGAVLCCDCARQKYRQISYAVRHNLRDGWNVTGYDNTSNTDESVICDHCSRDLNPQGE